MPFEVYQNIYSAGQEGIILRPGKDAASFSFSAVPSDDTRYKLFVTGETALFYMWKDEPDYPSQYHLLTDALDTEHAHRAQYCLDLSCDTPKEYIKRIYKQVMWPPKLSYLMMNPVDTHWQVGYFVKTENLSVSENGYLHMHVEIRHKKDGVYPGITEFPPDEEVILSVPEGTSDWTKISESLTIDKDKTDSVCVWIEGKEYSGTVYIEKPFLLSDSGFNLLPDFTMPVPDKTKLEWCAQNLSKKEWPHFEVSLNGEVIFCDEKFERCHRKSEWEIALPSHLLKEENNVSIRLISDYHDPLPYEIFEVSLLAQPGGAFSVISVSETASAGGKAYALVRTEQENTKITLQYISDSLCGETKYLLKEAGLHGIQIDCLTPCEHAKFHITACGKMVPCEIGRIVVREEDGVITGTGDMVYILQDEADMEEYLSWYIAENIGNFITIRPVYRWSGTRILNQAMWKSFVRTVNELGLKYVVMLDGRELPGCNCNPVDELMAGEGYLGRQKHEQDGRMFYWAKDGKLNPVQKSVHDMRRRLVYDTPDTMRDTVTDTCHYYSDGIYTLRNPYQIHDAKIASEESVRNLAALRKNALRHTGPSFMQKYLAQAGYMWLGAETMYSSMEPQMAFMRGTCKYTGTSAIGVHHATQWSSSPQDAPEHIRRLRLALYVSYMQGATDCNIEEGLWHLEEYYSHFHRFSNCCIAHKKQQQDFYRYVSTHSRTGTYYTPFAILQGRFDGWVGFGGEYCGPWGWRGDGNPNAWGWQGYPHTDAEKSWQMLKVFYPQSKPGDALYLHGCDTQNAVGYYSGTPMGNIDVLPAECESPAFSSYGAAAFLGYNCAEDTENLADYVRLGGTLILTHAHLTHTTNYQDITENRRAYKKQALAFTSEAPVFTTDKVLGQEISVCGNLLKPDEVLAKTDNGRPLICRYRLGKGQVILFCADAYPAHPAIRPLYETLLANTMQTLTDKETVWGKTDGNTEFTLYRQPDGSNHIYFLAVDWYREPDTLRTGYLRIDTHEYPVTMPFGVMIKCVEKGGIAAWPDSENGEVLSVSNSEITVQGTGSVCFHLAADGKITKETVCFSDKNVKTVKLK